MICELHPFQFIWTLINWLKRGEPMPRFTADYPEVPRKAETYFSFRSFRRPSSGEAGKCLGFSSEGPTWNSYQNSSFPKTQDRVLQTLGLSMRPNISSQSCYIVYFAPGPRQKGILSRSLYICLSTAYSPAWKNPHQQPWTKKQTFKQNCGNLSPEWETDG